MLTRIHTGGNMKTKQFFKKLRLNKDTVAHLNNEKVKAEINHTTSLLFCCEPTYDGCETYTADTCCYL